MLANLAKSRSPTFPALRRSTLQTMFWQRPARRQFGRAKNAVDAPALASTMSATAPPDRSRYFAVLAMQDWVVRYAGATCRAATHHPQHAEVQIQL